MAIQFNHKSLDLYISWLTTPHHDSQPLDYYEKCLDCFEMFCKSIENNLLLANLSEQENYLSYVLNELESLPETPDKSSIIQEYLSEYQISYDDLFHNDENDLQRILEGNPLFTDQLKGNYKMIQKNFHDFWYNHFLNKAKAQVRDLMSKYIPRINEVFGKLNGTEKLLLITLMQQVELFPRETQTYKQSAIHELISAITGISTANQVKQDLKNKIAPILKNSISVNQVTAKIKNIENIRHYVEKLEDLRLITEINNLEKRLKAKLK